MGRDFGDVLRALRQGKRCARSGWNGKGQWIALRSPKPGNPMTRPFIFICTVDLDRVPWVASQTDLLATDWQVLADVVA